MSVTPFRVRVPATSANLGPGFDCLGLALPLGTSFQVQPAARSTPSYLLADQELGKDRNLFWVAAERLAAELGSSLPSLDVRASGEIPLRRGLGSSASAVVGGLLAANHVLGEPLDLPALLNLATRIEGHPDNVAPALYGGITLAIELESGVHCEALNAGMALDLVVAIPDFELSTAAARAALPAVVPLQDAVYNVGRAALLVAALLRGSVPALREALSDRLHEPYRRGLVPGMLEVSRRAHEAGAFGVTLSGAGPSLLAWVPHERREAVAHAMAAQWQDAGIACRTVLAEVEPRGAQVLQMSETAG